MRKIAINILLVMIVSFSYLIISPSQPQILTENRTENNLDLIKGYTLGLQGQRENCYNNILLLGLLDENQIQMIKLDLKIYLFELEKIHNDIQKKGINHQLLNESIELDILLIKKTLTAIETKEESYLNNISEIYNNLLKNHDLLSV